MPEPPKPRRAHGPLVRALREALGLTLTELGDRAQLDPSYLSRVERGDHRQASAAATQRLAQALGVTPADLTGQIPSYRLLRTRITEWSIEEFAGLLRIASAQLEEIEHGLAEPDPALQARMARLLGVTIETVQPDHVDCPA